MLSTYFRRSVATLLCIFLTAPEASFAASLGSPKSLNQAILAEIFSREAIDPSLLLRQHPMPEGIPAQLRFIRSVAHSQAGKDLETLSERREKVRLLYENLYSWEATRDGISFRLTHGSRFELSESLQEEIRAEFGDSFMNEFIYDYTKMAHWGANWNRINSDQVLSATNELSALRAKYAAFFQKYAPAKTMQSQAIPDEKAFGNVNPVAAHYQQRRLQFLTRNKDIWVYGGSGWNARSLRALDKIFQSGHVSYSDNPVHYLLLKYLNQQPQGPYDLGRGLFILKENSPTNSDLLSHVEWIVFPQEIVEFVRQRYPAYAQEILSYDEAIKKLATRESLKRTTHPGRSDQPPAGLPQTSPIQGAPVAIVASHSMSQASRKATRILARINQAELLASIWKSGESGMTLAQLWKMRKSLESVDRDTLEPNQKSAVLSAEFNIKQIYTAMVEADDLASRMNEEYLWDVLKTGEMATGIQKRYIFIRTFALMTLDLYKTNSFLLQEAAYWLDSLHEPVYSKLLWTAARKNSDALLTPGKQLVLQAGLQSEWSRAPTFGKALKLFVTLKASRDDLLHLATLYYFERFGVTLDFSAANIPSHSWPGIVPLKAQDDKLLFQRLQEWAYTLHQFKQPLGQLFPWLKTILVAEDGRPFHGVSGGTLFLSLQYDSRWLSHELGHVASPITAGMHQSQLPLSIDADNLKEFATSLGIGLADSRVSSLTENISRLINGMYHQRLNTWSVLHVNDTQDAHSPHGHLPFWSSFLADLRDERLIVERGLPQIDGRKLAPILKAYDDVISQVERIESGEIQAQESARTSLRQKLMESIDAVLIPDSQKKDASATHHDYIFEVPPEDRDPWNLGPNGRRLRVSPEEFWAERLKAYLLDPELLAHIDQEMSKLMNLLFDPLLYPAARATSQYIYKMAAAA